FFFSSRRRHTRLQGDWSSDVCSSDLASARQMPDPGGTFEHSLGRWLQELRDRFLEGGSNPTSHELLRSYIRATFEFAGTLHPGRSEERRVGKECRTGWAADS